ncbi:MAG TPA: acireductone synthase [Gammaproteobacteria bacterium]|nr:acireductone synthase [Gammaproteobacteria bacterium]
MIRAILTDIEGTTSSISFVKDVLFPYAREHMAGFIRDHANDPEVAALLRDVSREAGRDLTNDEAVRQLQQWMDADKKITALKALQGMIWLKGYSDGDFLGHIYVDAVEKLQEWHALGYRLYIYSSGSVPAQKLLFGHNEFGDLTRIFSGYFDTRVGNKRDVESYRNITREISLPAEEILFLSDTTEELDAARAAGLNTLQLVRREDGTLPCDKHRQVASFHEINLPAMD